MIFPVAVMVDIMKKIGIGSGINVESDAGSTDTAVDVGSQQTSSGRAVDIQVKIGISGGKSDGTGKRVNGEQIGSGSSSGGVSSSQSIGGRTAGKFGININSGISASSIGNSGGSGMGVGSGSGSFETGSSQSSAISGKIGGGFGIKMKSGISAGSGGGISSSVGIGSSASGSMGGTIGMKSRQSGSLGGSGLGFIANGGFTGGNNGMANENIIIGNGQSSGKSGGSVGSSFSWGSSHSSSFGGKTGGRFGGKWSTGQRLGHKSDGKCCTAYKNNA